MRWEAAYRWLAEVDVDVVYVVPDGRTDVPKAERTGCWDSAIPKVLEYKNAYYQQIALNDWTRNIDGVVDAGYSLVEAVDMMGPSPPMPAFFVDTARKATGVKPRRTQAQVSSEAAKRVTSEDEARQPPPAAAAAPPKAPLIDFGPAAIFPAGYDPKARALYTVAPPESVANEWWIPNEAVTLMVRTDGAGRLRIAASDNSGKETSRVPDMHKRTVNLHGVTSTLRWRAKQHWCVARFTAAQVRYIVG